MKNYKFIVPCVIIAFLMGLLVMSGISRISASPARTQAANIREKRIVSVMVEDNDSIWSIAKRYYTEECGSMKDYIAGLMEETARTGAPVIRTMFFEFPDDEKCWELPEQYMFGSDYLVAPVLEPGARERSVYLPRGQWESISDKKIYSGGQTVTVPAPLDVMPVFKRIG